MGLIRLAVDCCEDVEEEENNIIDYHKPISINVRVKCNEEL